MKSRLLLILVFLVSFVTIAYAIEINEAEKYQLERYPDLAVVDIIFDPEEPTTEDHLEISAIITNLGDIETQYSIKLDVFDSNNSFYFGVFIPSDPDGPLWPSEKREIRFGGFGFLDPGIYYTTVTIYSGKEDSNLENNQRTEEIEVDPVNFHEADKHIYRDCITPEDGMIITENTLFCGGAYYVDGTLETPHAIRVEASDITIRGDGTSIIGSAQTSDGVYIANQGNVKVEGIKIVGYGIGVWLSNSDNITLNDLIIEDSLDNGIEGLGRGIYLLSSDNNLISDTILYNNENAGVWMVTSTNNLIYDNSIQNNEEGIHMEEGSNNNEIYENDLYSNGRGIMLQWSNNNHILNNNIKYGNQDGIQLGNAEENILKGNHLDDNHGDGIELFLSDVNIISKNKIENNGDEGIDSSDSNSNIIKYNYIKNNDGIGIEITGSSNFGDSYDNIIKNNYVKDNLWHGIRFARVNNNVVENNYIENNEGEGMILSVSSNNNTLKNNRISGNERAGIYSSSSEGNTIEENYINKNGINGIALIGSNNNVIRNNYIKNNSGDLGLVDNSENDYTIIINEAELNPEGEDSGYEWVELYSEEEVDLFGYSLANNHGSAITLNGVFSGYYVVEFPEEWLNDVDEQLFLNYYTETVDETPVLEDIENNILAWSSCSIGWQFVTSTQGRENDCPGGGGGGGGGGSRGCTNSSGICLNNSMNNLIYNNLFNNIINFYLDEESVNYWNTSIQNGHNIIGGPYIGGNYWANPDGQGYSETCEDSDEDGICDESYILNEINIDYLPLTYLDVAVSAI